MTPAQALSIATKFFERSGLPRGTRLTDDHCATIASTFIGVGDALKFDDPNMLELEALFLLSMLGAHKISWMNVKEKEKPWVISKSPISDDFRMGVSDKPTPAEQEFAELTEHVNRHLVLTGSCEATHLSPIGKHAVAIAAKLNCNLTHLDHTYVFSNKPLAPPNDFDKLAEAKDADIKELTEYVRYHIEPHGTYTAVAESRVARHALVIAAKLNCNLLRMDESYVFSNKANESEGFTHSVSKEVADFMVERLDTHHSAPAHVFPVSEVENWAVAHGFSRSYPKSRVIEFKRGDELLILTDCGNGLTRVNIAYSSSANSVPEALNPLLLWYGGATTGKA